MSDCGCDKAKSDLEEYLRNELDSVEAADIHEHMSVCDSCSSELHVSMVLTEAVKRACKESAPEELRDQVLSTLRSIQSTH